MENFHFGTLRDAKGRFGTLRDCKQRKIRYVRGRYDYGPGVGAPQPGCPIRYKVLSRREAARKHRGAQRRAPLAAPVVVALVWGGLLGSWRGWGCAGWPGALPPSPRRDQPPARGVRAKIAKITKILEGTLDPRYPVIIAVSGGVLFLSRLREKFGPETGFFPGRPYADGFAVGPQIVFAKNQNSPYRFS